MTGQAQAGGRLAIWGEETRPAGSGICRKSPRVACFHAVYRSEPSSSPTVISGTVTRPSSAVDASSGCDGSTRTV